MASPNIQQIASADFTNLVANADPQSASPLFAGFPPEIRAEIFSLALSSFPDTSKPYPFDSYWYRPGYTAPKLTDLSLLVTCKRIYEEARLLVWKEGSGNEQEVFWWGTTVRRPPEYEASRELHIEKFIASSLSHVKGLHHDSPLQSRRQKMFNSSHWSMIRGVHIFPQQVLASSSEAFHRTFIQANGLRPHTIKLTVRYIDWWNWEWDAELSLIAPGLDEYYVPESVDTLVLELESPEHKKWEMEALIRQVLDERKRWKWKRLDDEYLELDEGVGVTEWEWMGTTRFVEQRFAHHPEGDKMRYIVKVLTFTAKPTLVEWDGTPFDRALAIKDYELANLKAN
ncbi:hypothetical protein BKA70DRAFT_1128915 [Coprinopsis sp. MPI-PUGE-AT-0042]|nr:hypothetical protein BKA70DRAFT_1128915 [Coprinopsis sp. MPI-PUGE-AT-0042]